MISQSFICIVSRLVIWCSVFVVNDFNDLRARTGVFVAAPIHVDLDGNGRSGLGLAREELDHPRLYGF